MDTRVRAKIFEIIGKEDLRLDLPIRPRHDDPDQNNDECACHAVRYGSTVTVRVASVDPTKPGMLTEISVVP